MGARMRVSPLPQELVELARSQRTRVPELSAQLVRLLSERVECYRQVAREHPE